MQINEYKFITCTDCLWYENDITCPELVNCIDGQCRKFEARIL